MSPCILYGRDFNLSPIIYNYEKKRATPPQCRTKIYGSAITFYEEYPEEGLTEEQREGLHLAKYRAKSERQIFSNKCICVLSQWPFFGAFEQFLFFLHKRQGRRERLAS